LLLADLVQGDARAPAGEDASLVGRGSTMANENNGGHHVSLRGVHSFGTHTSGGRWGTYSALIVPVASRTSKTLPNTTR